MATIYQVFTFGVNSWFPNDELALKIYLFLITKSTGKNSAKCYIFLFERL